MLRRWRCSAVRAALAPSSACMGGNYHPKYRGLARASRPVDRAIEAGVAIEESGHRTRLFATDPDRRIYCLRRELLGDATTQRASEILSQVGP
jgi:hypothetical protein